MKLSKSGRGNIKYKRKLMKRKLFKMYILCSQTIIVIVETQSLRNNGVLLCNLCTIIV